MFTTPQIVYSSTNRLQFHKSIMTYGQIPRQVAKHNDLHNSHRVNKLKVNSSKKALGKHSRGPTSRRQRKPYTPQQYPRNTCVWFSSAQSWEDEKSKLTEGTKMVQFGYKFDITE